MTKVFDHKHSLALVEQRVGVESFEELLAQRKLLRAQNLEGEAKFGNNGLWDEQRRSLRGAIATELRESIKSSGGAKMSESALEDAACYDPRYQRAIAEAQHGKMQYLERAAEIQDVEDRLRNRDLMLRIHMTEASTAR